MALEVEATKPMAYKEENSNQNELTMKKLKRMLEVSSVICSATSISMVIACQYGGVPNILDFKSQEMMFDLAFLLIVASVVLGILAVAASRIQDRKLGIYFPALRISALISSLLTVLLFFKNKYIAGCEINFKPANSQSALNSEEHVNLKGKRGNQQYSNSLDNLSIKNNEDAEYSLNNAGKSIVFSPSSDESSEIKSYPQLQECHAPFLFEQCSVAQSPIRSTESLQFMQFDCEQMEKKSQLVPLQQKTFATNGNFNEANTINMSGKRPQVGVVSPIRISNSNDVEYCDLYKNLSSSAESFHTWQKQPRQRLNRNSLKEHQSLYQNASRIPVDSNSLYESNSPMKAFHKFPNSLREVFRHRLHTEDFQNLYDVQNKFLNARYHDSGESSYSDFQTTSESSHKFPYKGSELVKFDSHKIQEGYAEDPCYKLHRSVTPNFKSFQNPLQHLIKEAPHSQIEIISAHYGRNINSGERDKNSESFDVPMEICDKVPNDRILEVSMKLNDLNFMF